MCTLVVAFQIFPKMPLLMAANRDERLDRPSAGPEVSREGLVAFLAPRDLEAGGSWIGLNSRGVVAALTNRADLPSDPGRNSRGALVLEALRGGNADEGLNRLSSLPPAEYNPFNLVVAHREDAVLGRSDGVVIRWQQLPPGLHLFTERDQGRALASRQVLVDGSLDTPLGASLPSVPELAALMASHANEPLEGLCVHAADRSYGTRSSTLIFLGPAATDVAFLHAEGPPCRTPFHDFSLEAREMTTSGGGAASPDSFGAGRGPSC